MLSVFRNDDTVAQLVLEIRDGHVQKTPVLIYLPSVQRSTAQVSHDLAEFISEHYLACEYASIAESLADFDERRHSIGRGTSNRIQILDANVEKRHASFGRNTMTGEFDVRDEATSNGTYVNGRVLPRRPSGFTETISSGSYLAIADNVFMFVEAKTLSHLARLACGVIG